jgi:hypothetical protein
MVAGVRFLQYSTVNVASHDSPVSADCYNEIMIHGKAGGYGSTQGNTKKHSHQSSVILRGSYDNEAACTSSRVSCWLSDAGSLELVLEQQ